MRKKMVIEVSMHSTKSRAKAMTIAGRFSGVLSVSFQEDDRRRMEVVGDGIDAVRLTNLLRKNVGAAELVSVTTVTGEAEAEDGDHDDDNEEDRES